MKYLTPDIEFLMKNKPVKTLVKQSNSCGIFQDCMDTNPKENPFHIPIIQKK